MTSKACPLRFADLLTVSLVPGLTALVATAHTLGQTTLSVHGGTSHPLLSSGNSRSFCSSQETNPSFSIHTKHPNVVDHHAHPIFTPRQVRTQLGI